MNRARVLLDRGPKLFKKTVPIQDRQYELADSHKVLDPPKGYQRAPEASPCIDPACKTMVQSCHKYCPGCGKENANYSAIAESVSKGGRSQGFKRKAEPLLDLAEAVAMSPDKQEKLGKAWGDLVSQTRLRQKTAPPPQPGTEIAQSQAVAPSSSTAAPPSAEAATEDSPQQEYDLEVPQDVCQYIAEHWKESSRDAIMPVIQFFVSQLRQKVSKTSPLSHVVQKEIIKSRVLLTQKGREQWLSSWRSNRELRFVSAPQKTPKTK